jgi:hypothetical protein
MIIGADVEPGWISAIAAALAASTASFVAWRGSRELNRWRTQQRETKRAAIAGEVLVATLRFLTGLASTTRVVSTRPMVEDPNDEHRAFREASEADWTAIVAVSNEFISAWELCETYLPEDVDRLMERVWALRAEIKSNQRTFFAVPLGRGVEFFEGGWGRRPNERIEALRKEARTLLRPIAQMAETRTGSAVAAQQLREEQDRERLPNARRPQLSANNDEGTR